MHVDIYPLSRLSKLLPANKQLRVLHDTSGQDHRQGGVGAAQVHPLHKESCPPEKNKHLP